MFEINQPMLRSLLLMADIIEVRDPYTGGHVWRVSQFSKLLATKAGLPENEVIRVSIAAYLHDLGKVGIPDQILKKAGSLTNEEYAVIQTHPSIGARLLSAHPLAEMVLSAAHDHHERMDGKGYPKGLRGEEISLTARIVSVVDAFDAMTSTRPYRKGMPVEQALYRLEEGAGTQFDTRLVEKMCALARAGDLQHIIAHSAEGIPLVTCPHCGPVIAIPRNTKDGGIIYCRACHGKLLLRDVGNTYKAEMIGMTDDPRNLEPRANEDGAEDVLAQV
ncbi:MAG: hypothetical protein AUK01_08765 [Anaerolineae bacterium CG2_30_57_67]|nr:MAG: hypothetical protein AUK01_08765 [Anaerolineae bacterium CG2_30_57_67]